MQQIYRKTTISKCDFNKVANSNFFEIAVRHGSSPVNLLHIFRTPFPKNSSEGLLLETRLTKPFAGLTKIYFLNVIIWDYWG